MTRYQLGFLCVCALGVLPLVSCGETGGEGGSGGTAGTGGIAGTGGTAGTGGMAGTGGTGGMSKCEGPDECDDSEECTTDSCIDGVCEHMAVADDTECDFNGLPGLCASGACEDAMLCGGVQCDDENECTQDVCDPADGMCAYPSVEDGTLCAEGMCVAGECGPIGSVFPCTEQGIRAAIFTGGGPYTFSCDGPTAVVTRGPIHIWNDVILDGEGNLVIDGHLWMDGLRTAELWGLTVTGGNVLNGGGIYNEGTMTLIDSTVSGNRAAGGGGILNAGSLTLTNSTVSGNRADPYMLGGAEAGGIANFGTLTLIGSTVSGNTAASAGGIGNYHGILMLINSVVSDNNGGGIDNDAAGTLLVTNSTVSGNTTPFGVGGVRNLSGTARLINSTVSGNIASQGTGGIFNADFSGATITLTNTLVDNDCAGEMSSGGHNIESPGDTCGFDTNKGDQFDVTAEQLNLGRLQDNGGPTMTHALLPGSVAIDKIPQADCVDADGQPLTTDQRGVTRPQGPACDVGAFELEVAP